MIREVLTTALSLCLWQHSTIAYTDVNKKFAVESDDDLPVILWWDSLMGDSNYSLTCGEQTQCFVTTDKSWRNTRDVMVYAFYGETFLWSGLPFPRTPNDLWALFHQESPMSATYLFSFESTMNIFNYTSTFKRQSHFPITTNHLPKIKSLTSNAYMQSTAEKNRYRKEEGYAPIIFVQQECMTQSDREGYVRKLQKYIDIDSYGLCLHNKDFPDEFDHLIGVHMYRDPDFSKLIGRYKFAIAFESAVCDDYITETLWRPLEAGAVPIILGSPKVMDFLPDDMSAIIVDEFEDIETLATLLKQLDEDDEAYERFLGYRNDDVINPLLTSEISRVPDENEMPNSVVTAMGQYECFLCEKLHDAQERVDNAEPIQESVASVEHYGCPLPAKLFNDTGHYIESYFKENQAMFYQKLAKVFRYYYNKQDSITHSELLQQRYHEQAEKEEL